LSQLSVSPFELYCLDISPDKGFLKVYIRIGGDASTLKERIMRIKRVINRDSTILEGSEESNYWRMVGNFDWVPPGSSLIKVPITPNKLLDVESKLYGTNFLRRYTVGGNLAWITWQGPLGNLDKSLKELNLSGLKILGTQGPINIGFIPEKSFYRRIKKALDPMNRWAEVNS
jgi:hypothetical protein